MWLGDRCLRLLNSALCCWPLGNVYPGYKKWTLEMVAKDILPLLPPHLLMLMVYQAWHQSTTSQNRDLCINEPSIRSCLGQHLGSLACYTTARSLHWYVYQEVGQRVKVFPYPNACVILQARLAWEKKKISQHEDGNEGLGLVYQ